VFKCGPDFLDPQIHAVASGAPVHNVDLGICGEPKTPRGDSMRRPGTADLILVEGVMGLFDGSRLPAPISRGTSAFRSWP
jgi:cobyrinic acid a,c-diamide synthase